MSHPQPHRGAAPQMLRGGFIDLIHAGSHLFVKAGVDRNWRLKERPVDVVNILDAKDASANRENEAQSTNASERENWQIFYQHVGIRHWV